MKKRYHEVMLICDRCHEELLSDSNENVSAAERDVEEQAKVFGWSSIDGDVICADCLKKEKENK